MSTDKCQALHNAIRVEKKELKKLRRANESNRYKKIQTSSPVSDVAYSVAKCCRSEVTQ
jgi:hypothetical protein